MIVFLIDVSCAATIIPVVLNSQQCYTNNGTCIAMNFTQHETISNRTSLTIFIEKYKSVPSPTNDYRSQVEMYAD